MSEIIETGAQSAAWDKVGLDELQRRVRRTIVDLAATPTGCHIGGSLSVADILIAAFASVDRAAGDEVILSKGHAAAGLYAVMHHLGIMPEDPVASYGAAGSILTGHPNHKIPGVRFATGSLGHGVAYGVGWALARRIKGDLRRAIAVAGDGELQEGLCWEAFQLASGKGLGNFIVIVDRNGGQNDGAVDEISPMPDLLRRFEAFGFYCAQADGHDPAALGAIIDAHDARGDRPLAIVADTVKGKGVGAIENNPACHYAVLKPAVAKKWKETIA
ncbi:1-deoxy-D-xylulose-5-phosphate synthase N-terminal domain-containing protein [Chromobacterium subtsugae]|uniref:1-deoxy-D-xylulose-5-phosphate synthase N-terminal domain-containing protein n=1 Tax=Chromobacterium subtsugae TaxID=251747 RepID=UPI0009BC4B76|nr:1-deoxy-D-xylulose-5-phosphate synthase N-terminal domain-containing protein [Chromobacterium subtsugae]